MLIDINGYEWNEWEPASDQDFEVGKMLQVCKPMVQYS